MKNKRTILVDLDGVLNEYTGNYKHDIIPPIREGAKEFLKKLAKDYIVKIFTTRDRLLTLQWLKLYKIDESIVQDVTNLKEPAIHIIDDRALKFNGNYDDTYTEIKNFSVWYKQKN